MILYLTSNDRVNLLDFAEKEIGVPKKMTGSFSLLQFVVRDMRNYAHFTEFVIDRAAAREDHEGFVEAIQSFQTMYSARVTVICDGYSPQDPFVGMLLQAGVTNIVAADDIWEIQAEILECLSEAGMRKYLVPEPKEQKGEALPLSNQFTFRGENTRIAIAGCERRCGVTITAINMAYWIQSHGGKACYVESHSHRHLQEILQCYGDKNGDNWEIAGLDYYYEEQERSQDYDFIILDCGALRSPAQQCFTDADTRVLCGSAMPYDMPVLAAAVKELKHVNLTAVGLFVPEDLMPLLDTTVKEHIILAEPSHNPFDDSVNDALYRAVLEPYICVHT